MEQAFGDYEPSGASCGEPRRAALAGMFLFLVVSMIAGCSSVSRAPDRAEERGAAIARAASQLIGTPYHFGSADAEGFDCSGLVFYSFEQIGQKVPRTAADQRKAAERVSRDDLELGDLVFFRSSKGRVDHVGIYAGEGRFIHAPNSGSVVSYAYLDDPYYRSHFVSAGRF